jgi:hypothetical protein
MRRLLPLLCLLPLAGCYRVENPPELGEPVSIHITGSAARQVRVQALLQDAVAEAVTTRLGWDVAPGRTNARLELAIREERIMTTVKDTRDVPMQWAVRITATTLLTGRKGTFQSEITGIGYYSGTNDESEGLRTAAESAAAALVTWIESEHERLR